VDILCEPENRLKAEKIFLDNGYIKESVGEKDTSYRKEDILHFELHTSLLTAESPAYDYFGSVWDRVNFKENSNIAVMTLEDTYIFMLEHLANHIEFGGAGIRMYMDVYVFLKNHGSSINRKYIDKVLNDILLADFEKSLVFVFLYFAVGLGKPIFNILAFLPCGVLLFKELSFLLVIFGQLFGVGAFWLWRCFRFGCSCKIFVNHRCVPPLELLSCC